MDNKINRVMNFYEKNSGYEEILSRLVSYQDAIEDMIVVAEDFKGEDFDEKMDDFEKVLDENDGLITDIKGIMKNEFIDKLEAFDSV